MIFLPRNTCINDLIDKLVPFAKQLGSGLGPDRPDELAIEIE
jgi:hypothetical protein